jgi:hypothetical protein
VIAVRTPSLSVRKDMNIYVRIKGGKFEAGIEVDPDEIGAFLRKADALYRAVKATAIGVALWLLLRWWLGV